jgi:hypothetical protein
MCGVVTQRELGHANHDSKDSGARFDRCFAQLCLRQSPRVLPRAGSECGVGCAVCDLAACKPLPSRPLQRVTRRVLGLLEHGAVGCVD